MGQLTEGKVLTWEEIKKIKDYVREHGIIQFINLYKRCKDKQDNDFKWGDEIEYTIVKFDDLEKSAKLNLISHKLIVELNKKENESPESVECLWRPEFSSYQIESTPGKPFGASLKDFNNVEANMLNRRVEAMEFLKPGERLITITSFPRLGCSNSSEPPGKPTPHSGLIRSLFVQEGTLFQGHKRWHAITENVELRRGEKIEINVPIFQDKNVPKPFREDFGPLGDDGEAQRLAKDDHVYMDSTGFGMGGCCLQATLLGRDLTEAQVLYDQLTIFCPVMVALTAAAPIFRGYLTEVDNRWIPSLGATDDRTRGERGLEPLKPRELLMRTGRNGSVEWYLSEEGQRYNDLPLSYDDKWVNLMMKNGVGKALAQHVAHLMSRDPVSILSTQIYVDDQTETTCFENIQGSTWRSMRFKPPPSNSDIGWRVEFRPMDIQMTDFENAAACCFVILLAKIVLHFNLNVLIPLSKVEDNMMRSQKRDAVNKEKLWFRKDITSHATDQPIDQEYDEFTVDEIINGKQGFVGIIPLINSYVDDMKVDAETRRTIDQFLNLFSKRAKGELLTDAAWMRKQVLTHPEYKHDAVVSERINYDLLKKIDLIARGHQTCPDLFGSHALKKLP
ncbi:GSCOCG00011012001-RA-CDS [Cotesia congregata]|uniref:Glutamate--cysteine ligase n=1 Tax=Cotesia congregata TaxID=51543 RepID=A0A8J2HNK9_COTCN|nr:GSCOCG00011012001-RA-CDS [Cotesia congregata]CAG5102633.1 Similar to GCLC: Glutamate--cysteine ligase catalytic subunit (Homo sapiens) [Cotesia congregata]